MSTKHSCFLCTYIEAVLFFFESQREEICSLNRCTSCPQEKPFRQHTFQAVLSAPLPVGYMLALYVRSTVAPLTPAHDTVHTYPATLYLTFKVLSVMLRASEGYVLEF